MTNLWFLFLIFSGILDRTIRCLSNFNVINIYGHSCSSCKRALVNALMFGSLLPLPQMSNIPSGELCECVRDADFITGTFAEMSLPYGKYNLLYRSIENRSDYNYYQSDQIQNDRDVSVWLCFIFTTYISQSRCLSAF